MLNASGKWEVWKPEEFKVPKGFDIALKFPQLLIPTLDSVRAVYLMETMLFSGEEGDASEKKNVLVLGDGGTAKSSTVLMFCAK